MSNFLNGLVKKIGDDFTSIADDELNSGQYTGSIDTGSYALNALLSGSIYGGAPNNKVLAFAGEEATGKTFYTLGVVKHFLDTYDNSGVVYYDTEAAITKQMLVDRGIDPKRVIIAEPETLQQFRTHALKILEAYAEQDEEKRPKMMFVLDSLGMISTEKEMADSLEGKDVRDMTKTQLIKGVFRTLTLKLAKLQIPMIITNHIYQIIGAYVPTKDMGGGSGLKYAASTIIFLSKSKFKDATTKEVKGVIITAKTKKSRYSKENAEVSTLLRYSGGLDRYYGLYDIAVDTGVFKKKPKGVELPNGKTAFESQLLAEPEKYYTKDVLDLIDQACHVAFQYGNEDTAEEHVEETSE